MLIVDLLKDRPAPRRVKRPEADAPALLGLYVLQRGRLAYVDRHFAQMLGYDDLSALIGKSLRDLVYPQDRALLKLRRSEQHAGVHPLRLQHAKGQTIRVGLSGANTLYQGRPAHIGCLIDLGTMERMRAALEKYRHMLNEVDDAIAELDLAGNIVFSNTSVCRKWETLGDKTKTLNFSTYVDDEWVEAFVQAYKRVYETGASGQHVVYKVKLADGQRLTVEDSVSLMRNEEDAVTGFRVLSRNITDRIAAEKQLAGQRSQLEAIFRSVNDAIITVDPEFKVMESNRSAKKICGLDPRKMPNATFPDGLRCSRSCKDLLRRTIMEKTSFDDRRIACAKESAPRQAVSLSSSPLLAPDGRVMGAVLVMRDITLQESMESELHQRHQRIIGKSKRMLDLLGLIARLADLDTTVLITGESGTGKELVAKALHYGGRRASGPFVTVNCSALNESLLESELFGHVKGAFTDAVRDKQGRFEAAEGGTLLLDEIGDASPLIQLKLLRVLQEKAFERVGESLPRKANVRVVACTNKDLKQRIGTGAFREDFYYRLKVVQIPLPALRERVEDIPLLMEHFRVVFNSRFNKKVKQFSREVFYRFMNYPWPGNVRELEHFIERAFVVCRGSEIRSEHLPLEAAMAACSSKSATSSNELVELLRQAQWNKSRAAKFLGVSRQTLYRKMREQNIHG